MKKNVFTILIFLTSLTSSLFAQNSGSDLNYLKATNNLWTACHRFNSVMTSKDQNREKTAALPLIKKNIESAKFFFDEFHLKFPNDTDSKRMDLWIKTVEKSYESLNRKNWQNDPVWQMGVTLIELELRDFVNEKLQLN